MTELTKEDVMWFVAEALVEYDLTEVEFGWGQSKRYHGMAHHRRDKHTRKMVPSKLTLSEPLFDALDEKDDILDTVLHEVAHLIATKETGRNCGHGPEWMSACVSIGANPTRCSNAEYDVNAVGFKYVATCPDCGQEHGLSKAGRHWRRHMHGDLCYKCPDCRTYLEVTQNY